MAVDTSGLEDDDQINEAINASKKVLCARVDRYGLKPFVGDSGEKHRQLLSQRVNGGSPNCGDAGAETGFLRSSSEPTDRTEG